jgi:hypothetical protein
VPQPGTRRPSCHLHPSAYPPPVPERDLSAYRQRRDRLITPNHIEGGTAMTIAPAKFVHVVYRTRRFDEMI